MVNLPVLGKGRLPGMALALLPAFPAMPLALHPAGRAAAPSPGPLLLRAEDRANWPDFASCVANSSCPETALVAGDPAANDVVVFMHTTFDGGWIAFHELFKGWKPPFYAVALDLPGDMSSPPVQNPCAPGTLHCEYGFAKVLGRFQEDVRRFVTPGKRLMFVGHSLGATLMQDYVRRELKPAPDRIAMINNPTDWVLGGQRTRESNKSVACTWPSDPLPNDHGTTWTPTDNQGTLVKTACMPPTCWRMGSSYFTQINADWIRSPNYNQSATWLEDYMVMYLLRQCDIIKPLTLRQLILFGVYKGQHASFNNFPDGPTAKKVCATELKQCSYAEVECLDRKHASGNIGYLGWWPHIDNPNATRAKLEAFLTKP
ncbi:hypothetical protein AB1Y20_021157 [Prymnesium parvum]|uniref:AB hydrolase-1 domain-containing protein n=1 Tax=Prymnesium parvum TaxID=97485 RepID=A0AB34JIU0_PRYPA